MVEVSIILNALALFIPAMIGVVGSYWLYRQRQQDRIQNLRTGFLAEMEGTGFLDVWPDTVVPAYDFLSVSVYESNTDSLGLLSGDEVTALVHYYSRAKSVQDSIRVHSEIIAQLEGTYNSDTKRRNREGGIRNSIDKLELTRQRAMLTIEQKQQNAQLPEIGMKLSELPARLSDDKALLLDYGLAHSNSDDEAILTERGANFFHGETVLTGLEKERDVLDREKHPFWQRVEHLSKRVRSFVYGLLRSDR